MKNLIITIGREFGSGGIEVANELSKRLGIPVYDKELINKAAKDSGLSKNFFEKKDEKKSLFSLSSILSYDNIMSDESVFNIQCETIRNIGLQGSAIIVGRCSDYVLRDFDNTLNIFLTAPIESRIERVMKRDGISHDEALAKIEKKDKGRAEYYNYYTFGKWGYSSTYHLCIDTHFWGIEKTVDIIINALEARKDNE